MTTRRKLLISVALVMLALMAVAPVAHLLFSFPASLLIPVLLMVVTTALFYVWI
jgi:hypothetical protein